MSRNEKRKHATANYISELASQLAQLADKEGYSDLAFLLDTARAEAERLSGRKPDFASTGSMKRKRKEPKRARKRSAP
jgi:hypothetical protein